MKRKEITQWLNERMGLDIINKKFLYKELPENVGWWYTLGSLCLFLLAIQIITGIILACTYVPTIRQAYSSVAYIQKEMALGWLVRGLHHWGATMMILAVLTHMARVFFHAGYKRPNELTWMTGVCLVFLTIGMSLTGYILPWSDRSYWAATILATCLDYIPLIGPALVNFLGGKNPGEITIGRYAAFHMTLLPFLSGGAILIHLILIQFHGTKGPPPGENGTGTRPFFPYQVFKDFIIMLVTLAGLILLASIAGVPFDKAAAPLAEVDSVPKPEWFLLFGYEILKMFTGNSIILVLTLMPALGFFLIFFLPLYDHNIEHSYLNRPIAISCGITTLVLLGCLSLTAYVSSPLPGKYFVPDRPLSMQEIAGVALFEKNRCYSCHSIKGVGMKHAPDLWKLGAKREAAYISSLLKEPDKILGKGKMVQYFFDNRDRAALTRYVFSLNLIRYDEKLIAQPFFKSAYLLYRTHTMIRKNAYRAMSLKSKEEHIFNFLKKNKQIFQEQGQNKTLSDNNIREIAQYLAKLKTGDLR